MRPYIEALVNNPGLFAGHVVFESHNVGIEEKPGIL